MTALDDGRLVLLIACETEDRNDAEQRAMLRVARTIDSEANRQTLTNPRWQHAVQGEWTLWNLEKLVETTRILDDGQHEVHLPRRRGKKSQ